MGVYDAALVCMNGHVINNSFKSFPEFNTKFCEECGAATIHSCPNCGSNIRGDYKEPGLVNFSSNDTAPFFCHNCGKPYPWTEEKFKALKEIIALSEISEQDKEDFNKNLPDIISETPRTKVAALKVKNIGAKVGKEIWTVAKDIFIDIASETAKKTMGL